ncbi:hypothetical protein EXIGLDRAFT_831718 [Exidia glandulosa HHB12029]|uniref:Uncharacterized protein n=1 Tax=Exidia glandulosa HHB12029 TaxID=1314781 RepID=A0A165MEP8_EXIGL|nr:hypothetical protein EXIGLDRAFT_831718 [Exidia glandulosa HHB12029]
MSVLYFSCLNNRYSRTLDAQWIRYDVPHVHLDYRTCVSRADKHLRFIFARTHDADAAQLQSILSLWRQILERDDPQFNPEYGSGFLADCIDVDICDGLDTLKALENTAEEMGITGYTRILVSTFTTEPCECSSCAPSQGRLAALWNCAQKTHKNLPPALFERMPK